MKIQMLKFIKSKKNYYISFFIAFIVFSGLQYYAKGFFSDPDGFYHAKASQLLADGKLTDNFLWLPFTTWNQGFADQHYLYHLALTPLDSVNNLPISVVVFGLIFCGLFLMLLNKLKIPGVIWWTLLLLLSSIDFLFRINLVKASTLSLALMCLTLILLVSSNEKRIAFKVFLISLVSFVFVWTYGGFIFLPVLVGAYSFAILISKKKLEYAPILAIGAGIGLGILLHPHDGHLIQSLNNQLFQTGLRAGSKVPAGNEWLPYDLLWFVKSNLILLIVWFTSLGLAVKEVKKKEIEWKVICLQIIAVLFLLLALWHRRFIEYYVPFAVLASATTISPYLVQIKWVEVKKIFSKHWQFRVAVNLLVLGVVLTFGYNTYQVAQYLKNGTKFDAYKGAAQAIANASNVGDIVLDTQWDQFPQLWYWDSKNYYMVGMDPTFLFIQDPDKYWAWRKIADDRPEDWDNVGATYDLIKNKLHSSFVFVEVSRNPNIKVFLDQNHALFEVIYNSSELAVYKVK